MAGVDGCDAVGPDGNEQGVEPLGDLGGDQAGGDRVGAGGEMGSVLFHAAEWEHGDRAPPECCGYVGARRMEQ